MVVRKLAGIALAAGILISATGCSFNPSPESLQSYAPSDGVGITLQEGTDRGVELSNFLVVTDGTQYVLFGTVNNDGINDETVTLRDASDAANTYSFVLTAGHQVKFDTATVMPLKFNFQNGKTLRAGDTFAVQVGPDATGAFSTINVPLLDGTVDYYKGLLQSPSASTDATPSATPSATATPSN